MLGGATPKMNVANPVNSKPISFWRKTNQVDNKFTNLFNIDFNRPAPADFKGPTSELIMTPVLESGTEQAYNESSLFTVTITNCLITNTGSNGSEIKASATDYWCCNPNA